MAFSDLYVIRISISLNMGSVQAASKILTRISCLGEVDVRRQLKNNAGAVCFRKRKIVLCWFRTCHNP
jgi:hypothetical protein